jgi:hypothetical protein
MQNHQYPLGATCHWIVNDVTVAALIALQQASINLLTTLWRFRFVNDGKRLPGDRDLLSVKSKQSSHV